jgi:hypothetical protein
MAPPFLTSVLDGGEWLASRPSRFTPGTHLIREWVGPRAGLDVMEKIILPLPGIKPRLLGRPARSLLTMIPELYRLTC